MEHLTNKRIQEYVDHIPGSTDTGDVEAHLRDCERCVRAVAAFRRLETDLRRVPLELASEGFTNRVMDAIRRGRRFGLVREVLLNSVPLGIALLVTAILVGFFAGSENNQSLATGGNPQVIESFNQKIGGAISSGSAVMLEWISKVVGLSATVPLIRDAAGLILLFLAVKLFDEFVFVPLMRKRG
jgi:anti-sigma factor RsiW